MAAPTWACAAVAGLARRWAASAAGAGAAAPAAAAAARASPGAQLELFDGPLKALHRERAARAAPPGPDPLADLVAERLLDRLDDCTRGFARALVLGGAGAAVAARLRARPGVEAVTLVDTSPAQLSRARAAWDAAGAAAGGGAAGAAAPRLECLLADAAAEALPPGVGAGAFDVAISCLGLHWVNDVPGYLAQARAALAPDGLLLAAMLGGATLQELRIACTLGALERAGGVSPRVSPLAQVRDAGNLLTRAGLALPAVDVDDVAVLYPDAVGLVRHLRAMGESAAVRARPPALPRDAALAAAALYSALFAERGAGAGLEGGSEGGSADSEQRTAGSGESSALDPVPATFQVVYMTGWSPAPGQAGPRARGSATVSLADLEAALAEADGGDGKGRA